MSSEQVVTNVDVHPKKCGNATTRREQQNDASELCTFEEAQKPEVQNDVMDDPVNRKRADPQRAKEQPQRERADLQLVKKHAQLQGSTRAKETKEQTQQQG